MWETAIFVPFLKNCYFCTIVIHFTKKYFLDHCQINLWIFFFSKKFFCTLFILKKVIFVPLFDMKKTIMTVFVPVLNMCHQSETPAARRLYTMFWATASSETSLTSPCFHPSHSRSGKSDTSYKQKMYSFFFFFKVYLVYAAN